MAIFLKVEKMTNEKGCKKPLTTQQKEERLKWVYEVPVEEIDKADHAMRVIAMRVIAMRDTADMVKKLDNRKLCPVFKNGVLWATVRLENKMQRILGKNKLAILSPFFFFFVDYPINVSIFQKIDGVLVWS